MEQKDKQKTDGHNVAHLLKEPHNNKTTANKLNSHTAMNKTQCC